MALTNTIYCLCTTGVVAHKCLFCADPFRGGDHILVLCDTFSAPSLESGFSEMRPHATNNRAPCEHVMRSAAASEPAFSVEQQYTLLDPSTNWPVGKKLLWLAVRVAQGCQSCRWTAYWLDTWLHTAMVGIAGWPERASMEKSTASYCGVGMGSSVGRDFAETHFRACLHAGIPITGAHSALAVLPCWYHFPEAAEVGAEGTVSSSRVQQ